MAMERQEDRPRQMQSSNTPLLNVIHTESALWDLLLSLCLTHLLRLTDQKEKAEDKL